MTQKILVNDNTNGNKIHADIRNIISYSVFARAAGGTSADISFEGTADPLGSAGWAALAFREAGGGVYATTPVTLVPATPRSFYFDPADNVSWFRVVVANQTGPTLLTAYLTGEQ